MIGSRLKPTVHTKTCVKNWTAYFLDQERDAEKKQRQAKHLAKQEAAEEAKIQTEAIKKEFYSLFSETNPIKRGKALEGVLNKLFDATGILIREAFTINGNNSEGIIEQIDGVIEIEGQVYLVEMKWWAKPLERGDVAQHLVRVFSRADARGIFISNSSYTLPAIDTCREALQQRVVVLCKLEEFVFLLEKAVDIKRFLKDKINAAITHKNPLYEPRVSSNNRGKSPTGFYLHSPSNRWAEVRV